MKGFFLHGAVFVAFLSCVMAVSAADTARPDENIAYFKQISGLASSGDVQAMVCLGDLYDTGFGTKSDPAAALVWFQKAADKNDPVGEMKLAEVYLEGIGVKSDPGKALLILNRLLKRGYLPAGTDIGLAYAGGTGVPQDFDKEIEYFKKAADAGDIRAQIFLGQIYHVGEKGVPQNQVEATQWLDRVASNHSVTCMADFVSLISFIMNGYMTIRSDAPGANKLKSIEIRFFYRDGRAQYPTLIGSTGNQAVDEAWLDTVQRAKLPPWPEKFHSDMRGLHFWVLGSN